MPLNQTSVLSTGLQSITKHENKKVILTQDEIKNYQYIPAATGTLFAGTVLGLISATQKIGLYDPAATNGLQNIVGVATIDTPVTISVEVPIAVLKTGVVAGNNLTFGGATTLATVITAKGYTVEDEFYASTQIRLINITDITD